MFSKILISNRGEIACRIIRTARRLGIKTVAVYSTADSDSLHVKLADEAFCIGKPAAVDSYLNCDAIIQAAVISGANAIHPGYGFLSENTAFANACAKASIIFIGPSVSAMQLMASKQLAKQMLDKTTVPLTPGYHGKEQSHDCLLKEAKRIGFPVLLKAAAGGGGKGMRAVASEKAFKDALDGARREALSSFGDDTMLIEKLISNPRHVEVQIMADNHGEVVHLFDRDCSIQRRHQKIIEEAPAPGLSDSLRQQMSNAALTVARQINYRGAGTVEFLVEDNKRFYFMEMNTRLQVEHPVTELITGLDLVEWQLRIAANEPLPCKQAAIQSKGHAIESRIYAEDPEQGFIPSIGQIRFLKEPKGDGIRIDSGITNHSTISMHYDPMIAKLITFGENRSQSLKRMQNALNHYYIGGVKTNIPFLQAIISHPQFESAKLNTSFLTHEKICPPALDRDLAILLAATVDYLLAQRCDDSLLYQDAFAWQMHLPSSWHSRYLVNQTSFDTLITPVNLDTVQVTVNHKTIVFQAKLADNQLHYDDGQQSRKVWLQNNPETLTFYTPAGPIEVLRYNGQPQASAHSADAELIAPMPSTVVAILKNKGDRVKAGEPLMVLEAMKMEHTIHAPKDGKVADVFYEIGNQVSDGAELISLDTATNETAEV